MSQTPRQAGTSLRQSGEHPNNAVEQRHPASLSTPNTSSRLIENTRHDAAEETSQHHVQSSTHNLWSSYANDPSESFNQTAGFGSGSAASYGTPPPKPTSGFAQQDARELLRGANSYPATHGPVSRAYGSSQATSQQEREQPHDMSHRLFSPIPHPHAPMHLLSQSAPRHRSAPPPPPQLAGNTKYEAFRGCFSTSENAKEYRHTSMRFDRSPWKAPSEDPTIEEVLANRDTNVKRIYNAMVRSDMARDNPGSTAMKRWVQEANYPSLLVEAYAHKVFDALIEQVTAGFRGWNQNDYVVDERKGDDEDRDIDCAGRLDNIVIALEQEKSICENVMSSSNQIRMFVNAPRAYSKRKDQNRVGNGKRPNAKGLVAGDTESQASKRRKMTPRQTRARSSIASDGMSSRGTTPLESRPNGLPYYTMPSLQRIAAHSPMPDFLAPQAPPMHASIARAHSGSVGSHQAISMTPTAMSNHSNPQTMQAVSTPRVASIAPALLSPTSSSTRPGNQYSTPATPGGIKPVTSESPYSPWGGIEGIDDALSAALGETNQLDDAHFPDWPPQMPTCDSYGAVESTDIFQRHLQGGVSLADVENVSSTHLNYDTHDPAFAAYWSNQNGVQSFSSTEPHNQHHS